MEHNTRQCTYSSEAAITNKRTKPPGHTHADQITRIASHRARIMRSRLLLVNDAVIKVHAFVLLVVLREQAD